MKRLLNHQVSKTESALADSENFVPSIVINQEQLNSNVTDESIITKVDYRTYQSGNTFRLNGSKHILTSPHKIALESNHPEIACYGDSYVEIPITNCENECQEFKDYIIKYFCQHNESSHYPITDFCLDKHYSWNIQNVLEKNAIKTRRSSSLNYDGNIERKIIYELPIVGTLYFKIEKKPTTSTHNTDDDNLFRFKGSLARADRTMVYRLIGNTFENVFRYTFADIPDGVTSIIFDVKSHNSLSGCYPINAKIDYAKVWSKENKRMIDINEGYNARMTVKNNKNYWCPSNVNKRSFVVLDMRKNTKIKYISTMGKPIKTRIYPQRNVDHGFSKKQYDHAIVILDEDISPAFVKKFSLYGRIDRGFSKNQGGKWVFFGNYDANCDRITEKIIDISREIPDGFLPRYLKIVPLDYVGICAMRFMIYGDANDVGIMNYKQAKNVKYSIILPCNETFSRDGNKSAIYRRRYCLGSINDRANEKRQLKTELNKMTLNYNIDPDMFMSEFGFDSYIEDIKNEL